MKTRIISSLIIAGAAIATQGAHATDGTAKFEGLVTGQTCTINGDGSNSSNFTVALPTVSVSALPAAGSVAGRTPFNISLTGCASTGNVYTSFGAGPTVDSTTGALIVATGGATNVEIQLLNTDFSAISVGAADASQNSQAVPITAGAANLKYFAQYFAVKGAATAGAANSSVTYTLSYQ